MLRKRLVAVLTFNEGVLCRTKQFEPDYRYTQNFIDNKFIDEIILLDISRNRNHSKEKFYEIVTRFAEKCFVPITVGGGIENVSEVEKLLRLGADKISINTIAHRNPEVVSQLAEIYGAQCIVISIDSKKENDNYYSFIDNGKLNTGIKVIDWARRIEELGAGEILLNSIEKDGSLEGYDNELNSLVTRDVNIPTIVCGGAGKWKDFVDGINIGGASAVGTTNIYHFTETSIKSAKKYMAKKSIEVRMD